MSARGIVSLAGAAILATCSGVFSTTLELPSFNRLILGADAIVQGKVTQTSVEAEENGDWFRYTQVLPITVAKGNATVGRVMTVKTLEGGGGVGRIEHLFPFRVRFIPGDDVILLLDNGPRGTYTIKGTFRGKLDVVDDMILGTNISATGFLAGIADALAGGSGIREEVVPISASLIRDSHQRGKVATEGSHLSGQFNAWDYTRQYSPSLSIDFEINPANAIDGNGNPVSFASLKSAAESCAAEWNSIADGYINFTIKPDSSSRSYNATDGYSTITFVNLNDSTKGASAWPATKYSSTTVVSDIRFNTYYRWSPTETYPSPGEYSVQPKDFRDVLTHEMGHSVGLGEITSGDTLLTMWANTSRDCIRRRTIESGDKAGGVYMSTRPGRSGGGSIGYDEVWSAFIGSSELVQLQQNISVPSGKKLWIDVTTGIDWNGKTISSTGGQIEVHDDTGVTPDTVEARKGAVRISFNNTPADRLSNVIRYGTTSGSYNSYKVISTTNGRNNVVVSGLTNGTRYYFKLGNGAEKSNTPHSCRSDYDGDSSVIDFDDFFLWADHYGMSVTTDALQRYDLSGNAVIDSSSDYIPFFYPDFGHSCASIPKAILAGEGSGGKNSGATVRLAAYAGKAEIEVDVETSGAQSIKGYGLVIAYDPAILTYQGLAEGAAGLMARPGGTIDIEKEVNGRLLVGAMLKPGEPVTTGDRLLTRLVFRPVGSVPEQPPVTLMEAYLADEQTRVDRIGAQTTSSETRITDLDLSASPNPMNPTVAISFGLPESGVCDLRVYDLLGQQVKTLVDGEFRFAGSHQVTWEGMDNNGHPVASGTYLVQLRFRGQIQTQRLTVLR